MCMFCKLCRFLDRSKYVLFSPAARQSRCCLAEFVMQFWIVLPARVQDVPFTRWNTFRKKSDAKVLPFQFFSSMIDTLAKVKDIRSSICAVTKHQDMDGGGSLIPIPWRFTVVSANKGWNHSDSNSNCTFSGAAEYFLNMSTRTGETGREVTGRVGCPHPKNLGMLPTLSITFVSFYTVKPLTARGFELL